MLAPFAVAAALALAGSAAANSFPQDSLEDFEYFQAGDYKTNWYGWVVEPFNNKTSTDDVIPSSGSKYIQAPSGTAIITYNQLPYETRGYGSLNNFTYGCASLPYSQGRQSTQAENCTITITAECFNTVDVTGGQTPDFNDTWRYKSSFAYTFQSYYIASNGSLAGPRYAKMLFKDWNAVEKKHSAAHGGKNAAICANYTVSAVNTKGQPSIPVLDDVAETEYLGVR